MDKNINTTIEENQETKNKIPDENTNEENKDQLLITTTGEKYKVKNNNNNSQSMNDLKNNIEKDLRDKMNFIIKRTEREIKKCSKEIKNLKEMFKKIYLKNNNIYINMMKNIMINMKQ